jgi:branched-chain amino acid transport system ATP-binding protein
VDDLALLQLENISAGYGKAQVLFEMSLNVPENRITVVVGPNGSGKSTLLKTIMGLTKVYSGSVQFDGANITSKRTHKIAKLGIAYLPQVENVFTGLKVSENILMASHMLSADEYDARRQMTLDMFPILEEFTSRKARTLSGGERQMLSMAMALMRKPRLLLLDEPTGNLSPKLATQVFDKITELRDKLNLTIVMVEQNARRALEVGDEACLMVNGTAAFRGPSKELLMHPELGKLYLGVKA